MNSIGILAYGSLINNPGKEIEDALLKREDVRDLFLKTPFKVEFARRSKITRGGAPTLVRVKKGGSIVEGKILVLKDSVLEEYAEGMLFRREANKVGTQIPYNPPSSPGPNTIIIEWLDESDIAAIEGWNILPRRGIKFVLFATIGENIPTKDRTPHKLAEFAIKSAHEEDIAKEKKDGISYLMDIKSCGIKTPLMDKYEEEILKKTGTSSLEKAWEICRKGLR